MRTTYEHGQFFIAADRIQHKTTNNRGYVDAPLEQGYVSVIFEIPGTNELSEGVVEQEHLRIDPHSTPEQLTEMLMQRIRYIETMIAQLDHFNTFLTPIQQSAVSQLGRGSDTLIESLEPPHEKTRPIRHHGAAR